MNHWRKVWEQLFPSTHRVAADVAFFRTFKQTFFGSGAVAALVNIVVQPAEFTSVDWQFVGFSILGAVIASVIAATNAWNDVLVNGPSKAYTETPTTASGNEYRG